MKEERRVLEYASDGLNGKIGCLGNPRGLESLNTSAGGSIFNRQAQRIGDALNRLLIVGTADEPRLEGRRRQAHPIVKHARVERREGSRVLVLGLLVVGDRIFAEEEREQTASAL